MKSSGPRAFRLVLTVVAVVVAPFFAAIIICDVVWWSELGGAARDVVDVVAVDVVGARRSRSGRGRRLGQLAIGDGVDLYVVFIFGVGDAFHLLHGVDA